MRRDKKAWIGILALVGVVAPFSNFANASTTENNLLIEQAENPAATHKVAFVVSKAKMLERYENKTNLTDIELKISILRD